MSPTNRCCRVFTRSKLSNTNVRHGNYTLLPNGKDNPLSVTEIQAAMRSTPDLIGTTLCRM